jgi:hypothetical protein
MVAILLSAAVTCVASLFIGQAALRLCGAREWNWIAPAVGISIVMLIATPAQAIPGRTATVAAIVAVAAIVWCLADARHRPPLTGTTAVVPAVLLCVIPFVAVGHGGILGVSMDNDLGAHFLFVETYLSEAAENLHPALVSLYPLGPHATVALISKGLGIRVDNAFVGLILALPILNGWTAVALVRRAGWLKQAAVATVIGVPFLVVAYYAEGSFKEVAQSGLVLATLLILAGYGPRLGRGKWVPFGLLVGGTVCVYSVTGLVWPAVFGGIWLVGLFAQLVLSDRRGGIVDSVRAALPRAVAAVRAELPALGLGLAAVVLPLLPQAARIHRFIVANSGSGGIIVPRGSLGNLVAPLPGWEGFGVWGNGDFRLPALNSFVAGMWTAFVFALVLFGAWWLWKRGRWMLVAAAAASMVIWRLSMHSQSQYTVAKALVIASPLLMILALLPLIEQLPDRYPRSFPPLFRSVPRQPFSWALAALLAALLVYAVGASDVRALRVSPVGPTAHADELRELRPLLHEKPTLFLGDDDFIHWELSPVPVKAAVFGASPEVPIREEKHWANGMALDFDTVDAGTLDEFDYVITTRDAAGSQPPPQMHLVKATRDFELWHRVGKVQERSVLPEEGESGKVLECDTPEGKEVLAGGGVAAIRGAPAVVEAPGLAPGESATVSLPLGPGRWVLESDYLSRLPVDVTGPGLETTLPANLDRIGPRYPIGTIQVEGSGETEITFHVGKELLAPDVQVTGLGQVTATPVAPERVVPIHQACGKYVDWYRSATSAR